MALLKIYTAILAISLFFTLPIVPAGAAERIAVILNSEMAPYHEVLEGIREAGKRRLNADVFDLATMDAPEIVRSVEKGRYRLVMAVGAKALEIAASVNGLPILTAMVNDPGRHLGPSHAGFTGVRMSIPAQASLLALRQLIPSAKRVGIVYSQQFSSNLAAEASREASGLGITLVKRAIAGPGEALDGYSSLVGQVDAILLLPDPSALSSRVLEELLIISYKNRLPLVGFSFKYVKEGALLALSYEPRDVGADLAEMAVEIIGGAPVSSLPLRPVSRLTLHINARTAESMGIAIPPALRNSARIYKP